MLSKLQLTACLGLFLCSSIHSASAATKQVPIGQATTFDAGIDSDGHKTYIVHGYVNVNHVNSHNATKTFDGVIRSPISDLAIDHVQADLIVSGFSGAPNVGSVIFTKITPDDATGDVAYSLAIGGHSSVTQIHYTLFIGTTAVSPWPKPVSGPQGPAGPAGPQSPMGPAGPQGPAHPAEMVDADGGMKICRVQRPESLPDNPAGALHEMAVPQYAKDCEGVAALHQSENARVLSIGCFLKQGSSWVDAVSFSSGQKPNPNCGW